MLHGTKLVSNQGLPRLFATAAHAKSSSNLPEIISETSGDGIKLTCVTSPALSTGLARMVAVFSSGARFEEKSSDRGLAHLIRRSFGLSTDKYTAINLTRHIDQMGARINVIGTREHTIYTVDVAPNLVSRAGYLLAHMATAPAFYEWELKDVVHPLMKHDIDVVQRRNMGELGIDLLHEAAFGNHPDGTRLGRSLYSTHDRLGSYSYEQIKDFLCKSFMPGKCAITVMNMGGGHRHMDPKKMFDEIKSGLEFHPPQSYTLANKHDFVGNEVRKDISTCSSTHVNLAYHVPGGRKNGAQHLALAVAAQAIHGGLHNIRYADAAGRTSRLAKTVEGSSFEDYLTQCGSFYHSYSDNGLFGFSIVGSCAKATGERVANATKAMAELSKSGLTAEEVNRGKSLLKMVVASKGENMKHEGVDISLQVLETSAYKNPEQLCAEIDKLTPEAINSVLKTILGSGKMAMSVVGANTALIPPLCVLKQ
ncbi:ubiquinol-cytochrome c reductase core subunit 1 [Cichlidogyrus casuarinus]|uniref:Ubiquinol-cytochrome c reductase core subunit 1 n=1 Tax=Cichlidogyrus casuarinus TaxID=1844966 RepID=A0ABD2Q5G3_9PLAT